MAWFVRTKLYMKLPILFQSLQRIVGKERRSKLLHNESALYALLHRLKTRINDSFVGQVSEDRMDLHIEITKNPDDEQLEAKTNALHEQIVDLQNPENWGFLHKAFVLWTPEVSGYGKTHITIAYFGNGSVPTLDKLWQCVWGEVGNG